MIRIFHGDDLEKSRDAFNQLLDNFKGDILRLDSKQIDLNKINNFLEAKSLFADTKMLGISNFFSIPKANKDKLIKIFQKTNTDICIWQDKKLNPTDQKSFPKSTINNFPLPNALFACLNQIRPRNIKNFTKSYYLALESVPFDLLFFMIKRNLRKDIYKKAYLQLIELDYQNKSGALTISKEIALLRIMINLLS